MRNQTLFANAVLANQSINNGLIRTTNTVAWTGGNAGNGSSATPIEAIEQGAVDTTLALYNTLIGSVPRLPKIPPAPLPNSTLYRRGCNIIQYNNTGGVQWTIDISGSNVSGHNLTTDGTNIYAVGDFLGSIIFINSDTTQFRTPTEITTAGNGSFIVKYNLKGITQWVAYLTSQTFLQLLTNVTDSVNSYQAGNCFLNTNIYNSSGTLYDILKQNVTLYNPAAITNDGTFIYVIDNNPIVFKFKTTGDIVYKQFLGDYGLSPNILSVVWMAGYLYILDSVASDKKTIWQLSTTFTDPPVKFITETEYSDIYKVVSITTNLTNRLYMINLEVPNVVFTVTVDNTNTPPLLVSVTDHTVTSIPIAYPDGIITPRSVSYTYNGGLGYLIITDGNINPNTDRDYYTDLSGMVWRVGPVSTNNYVLSLLATTSTNGSITPNVNNFNYALSPFGVYSIYNNAHTILTTYISLKSSNVFIKFDFNGSVVSNKKITNLGNSTNLSNITGFNNTYYTLDNISAGSLYSVNYPSALRIVSKKLYPLAAYYNSGFIIQYNPSGTVSWVSQFGANTANCTVNSITIGKTGIYITGSYGLTGNLIFYNQDGNPSGIVLSSISNSAVLSAFVAKYTTSGTAMWATAIGNTNSTSGTAIYVNNVNNIDYVYAAGIYYGNRQSNVLKLYSAGGTSSVSLTGYNSGSAVYLVQYNSAGVVQWATNIIAATANTVNAVTGNNSDIYLVGSANGNITCNNTGSTPAFGPITISVVGNGVIIKYSSAGVAQWVTTLFGGIPYYISVSGSNLFISGHMTNPVSLYNVPYDGSGAITPPPSGQPIYSGISVPISGYDNDFLTTFTTAGIAQWGQNTSSPYQTSASTGGLTYGKNVEYVSVSIQPLTNAITLYLYGTNIIKYTNSGKTLWIADISGAYTNFGNLGTDGTNMYGTGTYYFVPNRNINDSIPIIINANKTITITSNIVPVERESGSFLVKYDTLGIAQWTNNLNNLFVGLIVYNGGKLYTTGLAGPGYGKNGVSPTIYNVNGTIFRSYPYITTAYVLQYNTNGNPLWCSKIMFEGYEAGGCFLRGIAVSSSGVYIVGGFGYYSRDNIDIPSVIKFYNANDVLTNITLSTQSYSTTFVAKYNTSGTPLWATKVEYNLGGNDGYTNAAYIAIDSASPNSIYMLGEYNSNDPTLPVNVYSASSQTVPTKQVYGAGFDAMILVKYDNNGVVQWAVNIRSLTYNPQIKTYVAPYALTVSAGYIYIVGYVYGADVATYDPINATTDPSTGTQTPTGNTMFWSGNNGSDGILIKYDINGIPQWKTRVSGTSMVLGSVITGSGAIYVGGLFDKSIPPIITFYNTPDGTVDSGFVLTNTANTNNFTAAYTPEGKVLWVQNTSGPGTDALSTDSLTYANSLFVAAPGTGIAQPIGAAL